MGPDANWFRPASQLVERSVRALLTCRQCQRRAEERGPHLAQRAYGGLDDSGAAAGGAPSGMETPGRTTVRLREPGSPTEAKLW